MSTYIKAVKSLSKKLRIDYSETEFVSVDVLKDSVSADMCMYLLDMKACIVEDSVNIEEVLGYSQKEFDYPLLFSSIHPDDLSAVIHIVRSSLTYSAENKLTGKSQLQLTYRLKKANGEYIHVLRKSGILKSKSKAENTLHYSILEDISFLNCSDIISFKWLGPISAGSKLKSIVKKTWNSGLTAMEKKIIQQIKLGKKYSEIAAHYFISVSTVKKHMNNIYTKTKCRNSKELLIYCNHYSSLIF